MMDEVIQSITNISTEDADNGDYGGFDGVYIVTDKQTIRLLISNGQHCCERWGYLFSNDDPKEFIGAHVTAITKTDGELNTKELEQTDNDYDPYGESTIFITLETDRGRLQWTAYNAHNGYYCHNVRVESTQLQVKARI